MQKARNTNKNEAPTPSKVSGASGEQLSFLPPPPFCPTELNRGTLADVALGIFMDGRHIDHPEFDQVTQSWRLAAVVLQLRTLGWFVEKIEIPRPTNENPSRCIALYHLPLKYVAEVLAHNGGAK